MAKKDDYEVTIVGGGMVGLLMAALLSKEKIKTAVIETKKPQLKWSQTEYDARVSAINASSLQLLKNMHLWALLDKNCLASLQKLFVWDATGDGEISFDSANMGVEQLGVIIENRELTRVLWQYLAKDPSVTLYCPASPAYLHRQDNMIEIGLKDETKIYSNLLIGADGANSWVREHMSSVLKQRSYHQQAIVATVKTEDSHQYTGWQVFLNGGPLALLPLADKQHCAIVWSNAEEQAQHLMTLDQDEFECELMNAFGMRLGSMQLLSAPKAVPLKMRHVQQYVEPRIALVGDAAHTIHPLAGQGVNLGFMDAACLAQCLFESRQKSKNVASIKALRRYERWRKGDNTFMILAMRAFKELFGNESNMAVQARNWGLKLTNRCEPVKNIIMKVAMGKVGELPELLKEAPH